MSTEKKVSTFRIVMAAILDFFTIFGVGGYLVAKFTDNTTEGGFQLEGAPVLIVFGIIIAYFVLGRYLGGTLWQRILRTKR
jgi:hypothetical protein